MLIPAQFPKVWGETRIANKIGMVGDLTGRTHRINTGGDERYMSLYLSCDASNVGAGAFLYQVYAYEKNDKGRAQMMEDLGFKIDEKAGQGITAHMLPGVSPGKNTPLVTDFVDDISKVNKFDRLNTLNSELTMTEKVRYIEENYILHVRPISFCSEFRTDWIYLVRVMAIYNYVLA